MKFISNTIKKLPDGQFKWKLILGMSRFYNFEIRLAKNEEELLEICRFRYKIYVEQLQRNQKYANHQLKEIREPLDESAYNIGAWHKGNIVGVVRVNLSRNSNLGAYSSLYSVDIFKDFHPSQTAIVTKLMVDDKYRSSPLAVLLALSTYRIGCLNNIQFTFIDCFEHLVKYFLSLGFRYYTDKIEHPELGEVYPLVLVNNDIEYLNEISSPFFKELLKYKHSKDGVAFYNKNFSDFHIKNQLLN